MNKATLIVFLLFLIAVPDALAAGARRVVVVVVPGATLEEMTAVMPAARYLISHGAVGVMNARTASAPEKESLWLKLPFDIPPDRPPLESAYLTLGAGSRATAGIAAGEAFDTNEMTSAGSPRAIFSRRTGMKPGSARILSLTVPFLLAQNGELAYTMTPGFLGEELHKAGLKTACIGCSDNLIEFHREIACLAMDVAGRVDLGDVSRALLAQDSRMPGGLRTDPAKLLAEFREVAGKADYIVVETGDSARVDRYVPLMSDKRAAAQVAAGLSRADELLGTISREINLKRDLLVVISPLPSRAGWKAGNRLAPIILAGPGIERGLLTSPSTRTVGLLANTDFAPTVLNALGLDVPPTLIGRPVRVIPTDSALDTLLAYNRKQVLLASKKGVIPRTFMWVQVALLALSALLIWRFPVLTKRKEIAALMLSPAALPLTMLATGVIPMLSPGASMLFVGVGAVVLTWLCLAVTKRPLSAVGLLAGMFLLGLVGDMLLRGRWIADSVYGHSASEGARYYGIGNEYMGYLIGAMILLAAIVMEWQRMPKILKLGGAACVLGIGAVVVGFPSLGANSGGGIAAAAGSAAALLLFSGARLNRRTILVIVIAMFIFVVGLVALDLSHGAGAQSHIGRAARAVASGGFGEAFGIIQRKLDMNIKLLKFSPSSRLMLACAALIAWLLFCVREDLSKRSALHAGLQAILIGAGAALIFNDSGVPAAANCLVFAAMALVAVQAGERRGGPPRPPVPGAGGAAPLR